jgi:hypothetical protein
MQFGQVCVSENKNVGQAISKLSKVGKLISKFNSASEITHLV